MKRPQVLAALGSLGKQWKSIYFSEKRSICRWRHLRVFACWANPNPIKKERLSALFFPSSLSLLMLFSVR